MISPLFQPLRLSESRSAILHTRALFHPSPNTFGVNLKPFGITVNLFSKMA
jgi:hypothetical protein